MHSLPVPLCPLRSFLSINPFPLHTSMLDDKVGDEALDILLTLNQRGPPSLKVAALVLLREVKHRWALGQWDTLMVNLKDGVHRATALEEGALVLSQWADPAVADVRAMRGQLKVREL